MAINPLPPQAYTKETLQKAYTWLLTQSASIKEMASSQEMLISLYLKAQRSGDASLETPSIQNFKQELKSLAGILGDLQVPAHTSSVAFSASTSPPSTQSTLLNQPSQSLPLLDLVSLQAIADVKQTLNLSSDIEAIRALIALGHKQFKKM